MARTRKAQLFEKTVKVAFAGVLPPEFQKRHAEIAREIKALILQDYKIPPKVETFVDGRKGAAEESVKAFGRIRYELTHMAAIGGFMLEQAIALSPKKSGSYKNSWFLMADGKRVTEPPSDARELTLTNSEPYHRKLEATVNAQKMSVKRPPGIVEEVRQRLLQKYGQSVESRIDFIDLPNSYVLQRGSDRRGRRKGDRMTYPALVVRL